MKNFQFSTALENALVTRPLRFPCPAKLNLFLYINSKRADGYHELQTLFQFLDFGDWLTVEPRADGKIVLQSDIANLPLEKNLVFQATLLLQQASGCRLGANLTLDKILPVGGGVGGGSSNAATALVALNYLWQTGLTTEELAQLGLQLGADVPIFVHGHSAFAEGVGEKMTYCSPPERWFVVLKPKVSISTAVIFGDPNLTRNTPKKSLTTLLAQPYANDCEKVVRNHYSEVEQQLNWLLQYAPARLTGTGACVFAEFDNEQQARYVFAQKPSNIFGFVAQGLNLSPLHQMLQSLPDNKTPTEVIIHHHS